MIHKTAERIASEVLRLLGRPRFFEISPGAPSAQNAFNNRCAPTAAPPHQPADRPDRRPATPQDAAAPHRSCSTPPPTSPPTARQTAAETDISNWDGTDICTLRLHHGGAQSRLLEPGRPYLDGIAFTIVSNRSTAILAFVAGEFDMTWPFVLTVPLLKDIKNQAPQTICELRTQNGTTNLLVNRDKPPFDNADLRRAMALTLDRKSFIDILSDGQAKIGGAMLPPPEGLWGMPPEMLSTIPGYDPEVQKNRGAAREIMKKLGYGADKRLALKVSTRNINSFRDPAVILIDQLKEIYI